DHPLANTLDHTIACRTVAELDLPDRLLRARLRQLREIVLGEMHEQVLSKSNRRDVDQPAALDAQALELRQRLALDFHREVLQLVDAVGEDRTPLLELRDTPLEPRPADEPQQKVRALEPLLEPVLLVSEPCAPVLELRELRGDRVEAAAPLRKGRVAKKRALALFSLQLEIIRELIESLGRGIPQVPQLKIDHRIRGRQRIDQQPLESFELLSRASDRRFLLLELV